MLIRGFFATGIIYLVFGKYPPQERVFPAGKGVLDPGNLNYIHPDPGNHPINPRIFLTAFSNPQKTLLQIMEYPIFNSSIPSIPAIIWTFS